MRSQPGKQTMVIQLLPNISRSESLTYQKIFGKLTKGNMSNIFLEKSCTKQGGETSPRLFSKKLKFSLPLDE